MNFQERFSGHLRPRHDYFKTVTLGSVLNASGQPNQGQRPAVGRTEEVAVVDGISLDRLLLFLAVGDLNGMSGLR